MSGTKNFLENTPDIYHLDTYITNSIGASGSQNKIMKWWSHDDVVSCCCCCSWWGRAKQFQVWQNVYAVALTRNKKPSNLWAARSILIKMKKNFVSHSKMFCCFACVARYLPSEQKRGKHGGRGGGPFFSSPFRKEKSVAVVWALIEKLVQPFKSDFRPSGKDICYFHYC